MLKLTAMQELFCQGLAKGLTQAQAYTEAGFRPDSANCSRLANRPHVVARVLELKAELAAQEPEQPEVAAEAALSAVETGKITKEVMAGRLIKAIALATAKGQMSAVAQMESTLAKLYGLLLQEISIAEKSYPLDKLLADLIACGLPEAIARRKLGFPAVNVIPLPTKRA